jgi:hypothetical protein
VWLIRIGAFDAAIASRVVRAPPCAQSTSIFCAR